MKKIIRNIGIALAIMVSPAGKSENVNNTGYNLDCADSLGKLVNCMIVPDTRASLENSVGSNLSDVPDSIILAAYNQSVKNLEKYNFRKTFNGCGSKQKAVKDIAYNIEGVGYLGDTYKICSDDCKHRI
jgi:hypothetical protein